MSTTSGFLRRTRSCIISFLCVISLSGIARAEESPFALKKWGSIAERYAEYIGSDSIDKTLLESWKLSVNASLQSLTALLSQQEQFKEALSQQYAPFVVAQGEPAPILPFELQQSEKQLREKIQRTDALIIQLKSELARGKSLQREGRALAAKLFTAPLLTPRTGLFDLAAWRSFGLSLSATKAQIIRQLQNIGQVLIITALILGLILLSIGMSSRLSKAMAAQLQQHDDRSQSELFLAGRWAIRFLLPFALFFVVEKLINLVAWPGVSMIVNSGFTVFFIKQFFALATVRTLLEPRFKAWRILNFSDRTARRLFSYFAVLQLLSACNFLLQRYAAAQRWSASHVDLIDVIACIAISGLFFAIGRTLYRDQQPMRRWSQQRIAAISLMLSACFIVITSVLGYTPLGLYLVAGIENSLIALMTIWLIALLLEATAKNHLINETQTLSPWWWVLSSWTVAFVGYLVLLPLAWGLSAAEIQMYGDFILNGFNIGDTHLSPKAIILAIVFVAAGSFLITKLKNYLSTTLLPRTKMDIGARSSVVTGIGYMGMALIVLFSISLAGIDLSKLALIAGALSVGIGFGLQNLINNFVSGIMLLIERPIKPGDLIVVGGRQGTVREIKVRSTLIDTFDRTSLIVPNSELISQTLENWTHRDNLGRLIVPIGVAYGSDIEQVRRVLLETAKKIDGILEIPGPQAYFTAFGDSALNFELRVFLPEINDVMVMTDRLCTTLDAAFRANQIEIPFPQRDLHIRSQTPKSE